MRIHLPATLSCAVLLAATSLYGCGGGNPYLDDINNGGGTGSPVAPITDSPYEGNWSGIWTIDTGVVVSGTPGPDGVPTFVTVAPGGSVTLKIEEDGDVTGTLRNTTTFANGVLTPGADSSFAGSVQNDGSLTGTLTTAGTEGENSLSGTLFLSLGGDARLRGVLRQARPDGAQASGTIDLSRD